MYLKKKKKKKKKKNNEGRKPKKKKKKKKNVYSNKKKVKQQLIDEFVMSTHDNFVQKCKKNQYFLWKKQNKYTTSPYLE